MLVRACFICTEDTCYVTSSHNIYLSHIWVLQGWLYQSCSTRIQHWMMVEHSLTVKLGHSIGWSIFQHSSRSVTFDCMNGPYNSQPVPEIATILLKTSSVKLHISQSCNCKCKVCLHSITEMVPRRFKKILTVDDREIFVSTPSKSIIRRFVFHSF